VPAKTVQLENGTGKNSDLVFNLSKK